MASGGLPLLLLFTLFLSVRSEIINPLSGDPCPAISSDGEQKACSINCFRVDPVCGVNGVTYWCGCAEAACAGVAVAKKGACQVGNGGTGQALLIVHIVWLVVLGIAGLFGFL